MDQESKGSLLLRSGHTEAKAALKPHTPSPAAVAPLVLFSFAPASMAPLYHQATDAPLLGRTSLAVMLSFPRGSSHLPASAFLVFSASFKAQPVLSLCLSLPSFPHCNSQLYLKACPISDPSSKPPWPGSISPLTLHPPPSPHPCGHLKFTTARPDPAPPTQQPLAIALCLSTALPSCHPANSPPCFWNCHLNLSPPSLLHLSSSLSPISSSQNNHNTIYGVSHTSAQFLPQQLEM